MLIRPKKLKLGECPPPKKKNLNVAKHCASLFSLKKHKWIQTIVFFSFIHTRQGLKRDSLTKVAYLNSF